MAVIKSLAAGAVTSLVIANLVHEDGGTGAQMLGSTEVTVLDHRVAWSWTVFAIATVAVWLLFKAVGGSR